LRKINSSKKISEEKAIMRETRRKTGRTLSLTAAILAALTFSPPGWSSEINSFSFEPGTAHIVSMQPEELSWDKIFDAKGQLLANSGISQAAFMMDDISADSKIDLTALAGSNTLVQNAVVSAANDIGNTYVALVSDSDGKIMILGGIERLSDENGYMTFEFNKYPVGLGAGGFGKDLPWEMTGSRTQGDILLRLNFADGRVASAEVSRWAGQPDTGGYQKVGLLSNEGCDDAGTLCAVSNDEEIAAGPWLNRDPDGEPSKISAHRFVEFKINAGALVEKPAYATICGLTSQDMVYDALKGGN
jgi:hypothetical protein